MKKSLFCLLILSALLLALSGCWGESAAPARPTPGATVAPSAWPSATPHATTMPSPWADGPAATPNDNPLPKVAWR